jgi:hypothetical protein
VAIATHGSMRGTPCDVGSVVRDVPWMRHRLKGNKLWDSGLVKIGKRG